MTYAAKQAENLAISVVLYVLERPELAAGFLGSSGLAAEDLRQVMKEPELSLHVLDYLLEDDSRVRDAAEALNLAPTEFLRVRTALAGPGNFGWEAD